MLNLNSIMVGSKDPKALASFYEKVFDKKPDYEDKGWFGFQVGGCFLTIGEHSEVEDKAKEPQRLMFNFETKDVKSEFDRISKVEGIIVVKEPYEMEGGLIATFADPDGNYFQLMPPWQEM